MDNKFEKRNRLSEKTSYVIENGQRLKEKSIIVYYLENEFPALTIVVGKKVGKSVKRNKLKRWTREIFRNEKNRMKEFGIVVVYKPGSEKMIYSEIQENLMKLWLKAGIID
ncbi:MAG: ribonuclease P protein component [Elusimicrobiota bacterium]